MVLKECYSRVSPSSGLCGPLPPTGMFGVDRGCCVLVLASMVSKAVRRLLWVPAAGVG